MAETLTLISTILYIVAGVSLFVSILLFFIFKIPSVISDLTGRTAKKSVEKMRSKNIKKSSGSYASASKGRDDLKSQQKKIKKSAEKKPAEKKKVDKSGFVETGLLKENKASKAPVAKETELLSSNETVALNSNETVALDANAVDDRIEKKPGVKLTMLDDVTITDTDEVIE